MKYVNQLTAKDLKKFYGDDVEIIDLYCNEEKSRFIVDIAMQKQKGDNYFGNIEDEDPEYDCYTEVFTDFTTISESCEVPKKFNSMQSFLACNPKFGERYTKDIVQAEGKQILEDIDIHKKSQHQTELSDFINDEDTNNQTFVK